MTRRRQTTTSHLVFATRLRDACDKVGVPPLDQDRSVWIRDEIGRRFRESVTVGAVRNWLSGNTYPRPGRLAMLTAVLGVEPGGLSSASEVSGVAEKGAPFQHDPEPVEQDRGRFILDRIRERLGGSVTVMPGVDLTDPTGEVWDAERD